MDLNPNSETQQKEDSQEFFKINVRSFCKLSFDSRPFFNLDLYVFFIFSRKHLVQHKQSCIKDTLIFFAGVKVTDYTVEWNSISGQHMQTPESIGTLKLRAPATQTAAQSSAPIPPTQFTLDGLRSGTNHFIRVTGMLH